MKKLRSKISFKGVIVGALTDVIGSNIWGFILIGYVFSAYHLGSTPSTEIVPTLNKILEKDLTLKILNWIVGGGFTVLGGYIAAGIAKKHKLLNATLASFLCVLSGLFILLAPSGHNLLIVILALLANPLLALFGGYINVWSSKMKHKSK